MAKKIVVFLASAAFVALMACNGFLLWQACGAPKAAPAETKPEVVDNIYHQIAVVQDSIAFLNDRLAEVGDQAAAAAAQAEAAPVPAEIIVDEPIVKAKAGEKAETATAAVLAIEDRLSKLEDKLGKLAESAAAAKISDRGAMVLSAAMLVKERADTGNPFLFEAEMLSILADGDAKADEPVKRILALAEAGVPAPQALALEFDALCAQAAAKAEADEAAALSWKQRFKLKVKEFVQIRRTAAEPKPDPARQALDAARALALAGDFREALGRIEAAQTPNPLFDAWREKAARRLELDSAVSRVAARSLALMKLGQIEEGKDR